MRLVWLRRRQRSELNPGIERRHVDIGVTGENPADIDAFGKRFKFAADEKLWC